VSLLRSEDERECEAEGFARAAAWEADVAHDAGYAAFHARMARCIFHDLDGLDVALAHDVEADLHLTGELRLVTQRRLVAAIDLRQILRDLLAHDERVDLPVRRLRRSARRQQRKPCS
jgi:hypothetical protein